MTDNIFNKNKNDYENTPLFLGQRNGVFDTVHKKHPKIWSLYKQMKSLDWDENEVSYSSCVSDFENCDKSTYDMMIKTLAFQWEADSIANRISPLVGCYVTSSELWAAWQEVSKNETVHAATYSEIVRNSFKDPSVVINEILAVEHAMTRMNNISKVISDAARIGHEYQLGMVSAEEAYDAIFMFTVAMLCLERIQFMSSFAVTFAICDTGLFQPIGKIVQKIAQDELEIHVELDKEILRTELKTERGQKCFSKNEQLINAMIDEVLLSEFEWIEYLFSEGRSIVGLTPDLLKRWSAFCAKDVYKFFNLSCNVTSLPASNPLPFMANWLDISKTQPSPQEQANTQYKTNVISRDDEGMEFDL